MTEPGAVNWTELGEGLAIAVMAALAAFAGARRVWSKGLSELLRPAIQKEVGAAVRLTMRTLARDTAENLSHQVRSAVHEELAPLREEVDRLQERVAHMEGALVVLTNTGIPPRDSSRK